MTRKTTEVRASVLNAVSASTGAIAVVATSEMKRPDVQLAAMKCESCDTEFAAEAGFEPYCPNCGSHHMTASTLKPQELPADQACTAFVCDSCGTHNVLADAVVASFDGRIHCTACGTAQMLAGAEEDQDEDEQTQQQDEGSEEQASTAAQPEQAMNVKASDDQQEQQEQDQGQDSQAQQDDQDQEKNPFAKKDDKEQDASASATVASDADADQQEDQKGEQDQQEQEQTATEGLDMKTQSQTPELATDVQTIVPSTEPVEIEHKDDDKQVAVPDDNDNAPAGIGVSDSPVPTPTDNTATTADAEPLTEGQPTAGVAETTPALPVVAEEDDWADDAMSVDAIPLDDADVLNQQQESPDVEQIVEMSLLATVLASADAPKLSLVQSATTIHAFIDEVHVAKLERANVKPEYAPLFEKSLAKAVLHVASTKSIESALADYGFTSVTVKFPLAKVTASVVAAKAKEQVTAAADKSKTYADDLTQCLSIAATGLAKGYWSNLQNPLAIAMTDALASCGVSQPKKIVANIMASSVEGYNRALLTKAVQLMATTVEFRNDLANNLSVVTAGAGSEVEEDDESVEASLMSPAKAVVANVQPQSKIAKLLQPTQTKVHASKSGTSIRALLGSTPLFNRNVR